MHHNGNVCFTSRHPSRPVQMNREQFPALLLVLAAVANGGFVSADEQREFFENKIRPVLVEHCYECHSVDSHEVGGKLLVDSRDGMLVGGESGPVLLAGQPDASLIIQALRYDDLEMPPEAPLPEAVINDFVRWISLGAADPRPDDARQKVTSTDDTESLWSFLPRQMPTVPAVQNVTWPRDSIDHFVLARLEQAALAPTHDADPRTLVRRLYYDLIGLPPTREQVDSFVNQYRSDDQAATGSLVDALLASPQYGVRWGRHWLDIARYGESNGDDGLGRNATFPHAWRYRDYVVDAFNQDLPYDRFLTEQIAGDLLPADTAEQRNRQLIATGFLAIGSKPASAMNKNFAMDIVDDQINVVCTAVMGLSVACARCHDHKHDPIPTRDYYALAGIFSSTETLYGAAGNEKLTAPATPLHELSSAWNKDEVRPDRTSPPKFPQNYSQDIDALKPSLHARLEARGVRPGPVDGYAMGVREKAKPSDCKIHINGEASKLGPVVPRGVLTYDDRTAQQKKSSPGEEISIDQQNSGRAELAQWLTRADHPQTARVMVNRVWLHLFGQGIVATPDDFGVYGARPTHPDLLDHLADRFVREGWSVKRLIRAIVLSRTYQLDCQCDQQQLDSDPDNQWMARHNRRRLDAESLRDSMLQVSGLIDYAPDQGSAIEKVDALINWPPGEATELHRESNHRSLYLCLLRHAPPRELAAFDLPDAVGVAGHRESTTLPTQALFLLNSDFVVKQSQALAQRVLDDQRLSDAERAEYLFSTTLQRCPNESERARSLEHVRESEEALAEMIREPSRRQLAAWASLCQALLTANEFRYVD